MKEDMVEKKGTNKLNEEIQEVVMRMKDGTKTAEGKPRRTMWFLTLDIIRSMGPNCANRGGDGSPKSVIFGGVPRIRWSAQAIQFVCRWILKNNPIVAEYFAAVRTREIATLLKNVLLEMGTTKQDAATWAKELESVVFETKKTTEKKKTMKKEQDAKALEAAASAAAEVLSTQVVDGEVMVSEEASPDDSADATSDSGEKKVKDDRSLVFLSPSEVRLIAKQVVEKKGLILGRKIKVVRKELSDLLRGMPRIEDDFDRKLGGGMSANIEGLLNDAVMCISHAVSTEECTSEIDYIAALDDLKRDEKGAAFLGQAEYSATVMHFTVVINVNALFDESELGNDKKRLILSEIVKAYMMGIPAGRRNKMFSDTEAEFVMVHAWDGAPMSMVNAFHRPVSVRNGKTILDASREALQSHSSKMVTSYGTALGVREVSRYQFGADDICEFSKKVANEFIK